MFPLRTQPINFCPSRSEQSRQFAPSETDLKALLIFLAEFRKGLSPFTSEQTSGLVKSRFSIPSRECPNVCSYSPLACSAVCAGASLGAASVMVGLASVGSKTALAFLGGLIAGTANGSGTCLTSIEASHRDNRQNLVGAINQSYRSASNCLIENYIISAGEQKAEWENIAREILTRQEVVEEAISLHISPQGNLNVLIQAAKFVVSREIPTDELLKNQIATFDSPTNAQHADLANQLQQALKRIENLERAVLHTTRTEV